MDVKDPLKSHDDFISTVHIYCTCKQEFIFHLQKRENVLVDSSIFTYLIQNAVVLNWTDYGWHECKNF